MLLLLRVQISLPMTGQDSRAYHDARWPETMAIANGMRSRRTVAWDLLISELPTRSNGVAAAAVQFNNTRSEFGLNAILVRPSTQFSVNKRRGVPNGMANCSLPPMATELSYAGKPMLLSALQWNCLKFNNVPQGGPIVHKRTDHVVRNDQLSDWFGRQWYHQLWLVEERRKQRLASVIPK